MNSSSSDDTQPFHRNDCYFSRMMALRNAYSRIIWQPISTKSNGSIESNRSSSWIRLRHVHFFCAWIAASPLSPPLHIAGLLLQWLNDALDFALKQWQDVGIVNVFLLDDRTFAVVACSLEEKSTKKRRFWKWTLDLTLRCV